MRKTVSLLFLQETFGFSPLDWESSFHPRKSLWHIAHTFYIKASQGNTETSEVFHFPESHSQFLRKWIVSLPRPLPSGQSFPSPILVSLIWVTAWALFYGITFSPGRQFMQNTPCWESGNLPIRHSFSSKTLEETWSECLKSWLACPFSLTTSTFLRERKKKPNHVFKVYNTRWQQTQWDRA